MASGVEIRADTSPSPVEYDSTSKPDGIEADPAIDTNTPPQPTGTPPEYLAYSSPEYQEPLMDQPITTAHALAGAMAEYRRRIALETPTGQLPIPEQEQAPLSEDLSRTIGHTGIEAAMENPATQRYEVGPSAKLQHALEVIHGDETSFSSAMNVFHETDLETEDTLTLLEAISDRYNKALSDRQRGRIDGLAEAVVMTARKNALQQGMMQPQDIENIARAVDITDGTILQDLEDTVELFEHPKQDPETGSQQNISIDPTLADLVREAIVEYNNSLGSEEPERNRKLYPLIVMRFNNKFIEALPSELYGQQEPEPTQATPPKVLVSQF